MVIQGIIDGEIYFWRGDSWVADRYLADNLSPAEAERRMRIILANNRFLDRDERAEACILES